MGERRSTAAPIKSRVKNRSLMAQCLWLLVVLTAAQRAEAEPVAAAVTLVGQRVALDAAEGDLTVEVTIQNHLDVPLTAVDVGWLLAPSAEALGAVTDPGALYLAKDDPKHAMPPAGVVVLRKVVGVAVKAHASAPASFVVPLVGSIPQVYRTHILGYALADANVPLLLRLLSGSAAADERAAVDFFSLTGSAQERAAARARLDAPRWLAELAPRLGAPVPQRPSATELHERLFAVRAAGVLGGERAEQLLTGLRDRGDIMGFDELLRVVLIDRLRGTRLETPLAFAVPASARSFRDVVDAALDDARRLAELASAEERPSGFDGSASIAKSREPSADDRSPGDDDPPATLDGGRRVDVGMPPNEPPPVARPFDLREQLAGLGVVVAASVITLWLLRRNK